MNTQSLCFFAPLTEGDRMTGFVAHLDADAFYVSAERVRHPDLVGKPVAVLGNNGACCIAKSYEAKAAGIRTGMPIWDAVRVCPEGVYVKRDFYWYEVLSRKMLAIVGTFSPKLEYYSIDEFFFEVVPGDHRSSAAAIRDHILAAAGLPVTIAVARTRTLAKLFSDTAKPFGAVAVLDRDHERALRPLPASGEVTRTRGWRGLPILAAGGYAPAGPSRHPIESTDEPG